MALLSICVPTYNRREKLINLVDFFVDEGIFNEDVELIISENCCTDGTGAYLDSFSKTQKGALEIIHQKKNIGGQNNINFLFGKANGKYIWVVGDDDQLYHGIVSEIIEILKKYNDIAWIFIKHNMLTDRGIISKECIENENGYFKNGIELFRDLSNSDLKLGPMMFITANVYRTDLLKRGLDIYKKSGEFSNMSVSLGLAFYCAANGNAAITNSVLITDNSVNISWHDKEKQVLYRDMFAIMDIMAKGMGHSLSHYIDIRKSFFSYSEFRFISTNETKDNYVMKYWLKNNPFFIVIDFFGYLGFVFSKIGNHLFVKKDFIKFIKQHI